MQTPLLAASISPTARWLALIVLLGGGFLGPVDFFIVNVALPSIQGGLGASEAAVQLVISSYSASYAVLLITGGRLGDLYGRKRVFALGMTGFTVASALCGVAPSATVLVLARVAEGAAAALIAPQVLGSIRALYADRELARALSLYGVMMGLAAVTGQFAGGALVALSPWGLGWRAVFLVNLPIGAAALIGAWLFVPETSARIRPRLDLGGAALLSLALVCLIVPLAEGRQMGWPAWAFVMLAATLPLLWTFLWLEDRIGTRAGMPLVDLELLAVKSFRRGMLVATLFFFTSPFYLMFAIERQDGAGLDPLHTGLSLLPYGVGLFAGPLASAPLLGRLHQRLLTIGLAVEATGYAATAAAVAVQAGRLPLIATVFVGGLGQGVAMPRLFNTVLEDVPSRHAGLAAGLVNSTLQIGAAVSVAAVGTLFFAMLGKDGGPAAYAHAFGISMITVVAALAGATVLSR